MVGFGSGGLHGEELKEECWTVYLELKAPEEASCYLAGTLTFQNTEHADQNASCSALESTQGCVHGGDRMILPPL